MFEQRGADCQPRFFRVGFWAPNANFQLLFRGDGRHFFRKARILTRVDIEPTHHRKDGRLVVIVHLDLRDVRTAAGHIMDDRIGKPDVVRTDGCYNYFHGEFGD